VGASVKAKQSVPALYVLLITIMSNLAKNILYKIPKWFITIVAIIFTAILSKIQAGPPFWISIIFLVLIIVLSIVLVLNISYKKELDF